jgi:hypothetical protein
MSELSPDARDLIDTVGTADGPSAGDRKRIRAALFSAIAAGTTVAASTQVALGAHAGAGIAKAAVHGEIAAGTGLAALTGKGTMAVALWFIAGGAAGTAVATPVALYTERPEPAVVEPAPAARAGERTAPPAVAIARPTPVAANETPRAEAAQRVAEPARATRDSADESAAILKDRSQPQPRLAAPANSPSAPSLATEVRLLKSAQRELSAANASASLALLDEHARLYPDGALKAERLAARVFALCKLGHVEQAREVAREFLRVAEGSPLVPRVLASCAGTHPHVEKPR